jgi:hypothetical protein
MPWAMTHAYARMIDAQKSQHHFFYFHGKMRKHVVHYKTINITKVSI